MKLNKNKNIIILIIKIIIFLVGIILILESNYWDTGRNYDIVGYILCFFSGASILVQEYKS